MTITDEWRDRIEAELRRRRMTRKELARSAKCSQSTITNLLKPGERQARAEIADGVAKILGIPLPAVSGKDRPAALAERLAAKLRWAIVHDRKEYDFLEDLLLRILNELPETDVKRLTTGLKSVTGSAEEEDDGGAGEVAKGKGTKRKGGRARRGTRR